MLPEARRTAPRGRSMDNGGADVLGAAAARADSHFPHSTLGTPAMIDPQQPAAAGKVLDGSDRPAPDRRGACPCVAQFVGGHAELRLPAKMLLLTAEHAETIRHRLNTTAALQLFDSMRRLPFRIPARMNDWTNCLWNTGKATVLL